MRHLVLRIHTGAVRAAALSTVSRSLVTGSLTIELRGTLCGDALKEIVAVDAGTGGLTVGSSSTLSLDDGVLRTEDHAVADDVVTLESTRITGCSRLDIDLEHAQTVDTYLAGALQSVTHDLHELGQAGLDVGALERAVALDGVGDVVEVHRVGVDGTGVVLAEALAVLDLVLIQTIINRHNTVKLKLKQVLLASVSYQEGR